MVKRTRVSERNVLAPDGTRIAYHVVGEGPTILLCNGLGGSWKAWKHQIEYFSNQYQFISWDYRGLYASERPSNLDTLAVQSHAWDGLLVLQEEGVERAALWGWSLGVQVALEIFRHEPAKVESMVLVGGLAGRPYEFFLNTALLAAAMPRLVRSTRPLARLVSMGARWLGRFPEATRWIAHAGVAARAVDDELWHELIDSFGGLDMDAYSRILEKMGEHDAWDVLQQVDVPTLVIAGAKDLLTPENAARRMASAIRGAEFMVVPRATHYVAFEYPEMVNLRIQKFLETQSYHVQSNGVAVDQVAPSPAEEAS